MRQHLFATAAAIALLVACAPSTARAEEPTTWRSVGIGGGGAMFSPAFNPHDPNDLFVACDMSELFRTRDLGATWEPAKFYELQGNRLSRVQFTNDPNILYCLDYTPRDLVDGQWPMKSTDGGLTWNDMPADPTDGEVYSLWADPDNASRVLLTSYNALYVSTNGGLTFSFRAPPGPGPDGFYVGGVFFDGPEIYIGSSSGLWYSPNNGASFLQHPASGFPGGFASLCGAREGDTVRLFGLSANANGLYPGLFVEDLFFSAQTVFSLTIGDSGWSARHTGLPANGMAHVACARGEADTVYVAGQAQEAELPLIYKSTNAGQSWTNVFLYDGNQNIATGWSGHLGDRQWTYGGGATGFAVASNDPNKVAYTDYGFVHLTTDGGANWRQAYVNPADQNPAGAATPKNRHYRGNGIENTSCWWVAWSDADNVFVPFSDIRGIRSEDGGDSWSFDYTGHTENSGYWIERHPQTGVLYMGTSTAHDIYQSTYLTDSRLDGAGGRLMMSSDQGRTWQVLRNFGHPVIGLGLDPNNPNRMYASVIDSALGDVYVTNDLQNGAASQWTRLASPPRTQGHPFNVRVLNDGALVATYCGRRDGAGAFTPSSGVFMSLDGGATWSDRSDPGMLYWTKDLILAPADPSQNTWLACVYSGWGGAPNGLGGLYRSTNRGQSWNRLVDLDRVASIAFNPQDPNEAYLTTEIEGLWRSGDMGEAAPSFARVDSFPFRQPERVFFNPHDLGEMWVTSFGGGIRIGRVDGGATSGASGWIAY
jgi:photosystem II stability/assembly factor-like uncharacterized protein